MALHPTIILIEDRNRIEPVLDAMRPYTLAGRGWVNIQPEVAEPEPPPNRSALTQFFRRNSPDVALGTWTAPTANSPDGAQNLGLQHALGTRIGPYLGDWDLEPREGWRRLQDSPRRGLLLSVPADEAHEVIVRWLLDVTQLATRQETTGRWSASLYEGRGG